MLYSKNSILPFMTNLSIHQDLIVSFKKNQEHAYTSNGHRCLNHLSIHTIRIHNGGQLFEFLGIKFSRDVTFMICGKSEAPVTIRPEMVVQTLKIPCDSAFQQF